MAAVVVEVINVLTALAGVDMKGSAMTKQRRFTLLPFAICLLTVPAVICFSVDPHTHPLHVTSHQPPSHVRSWRLASSKEDEIRELEEKLQRLKEEAAEEETVAVKEEENIQLNEQAVYTELLTEQWKEEAAKEATKESVMNSVGTALATIGLLVGLVLFSQVPVGQEELSRYSTPTSAPSTQIDLGDLNRARNGSDI